MASRASRLTRWAPAAALVALLILAGCAAGDEAPVPRLSPTTPLDAVYAALGAWDEEAVAATAMQEEIASCMNEQGFEYIPIQPATAGPDESADLSPVEYAQEFGYGLTTYDELSGARGDVDEAVEDPNAETLAVMTSAEREAWSIALHGDPEPQTQVPMGEPIPEDLLGCEGRAMLTLPANAVFADPRWKAFDADMSLAWDAFHNDDRVAELIASWASCLADAGHGPVSGLGDPHEVITQEWIALPTDDAGLPLLGPLAELREREIATAVADATCRETVGYYTRSKEILAEYQQAVIDAHQAEVDALVEQYG